MRIIGVRSSVSPLLIAAALVLYFPTLVAGQPDPPQAAVHANEPIEVTFTKWRTVGVPLPPAVATRSLFVGNVGGGLGEGTFVGEVLDRKVSTPCTFTTPPCTPGITPPTITGSIASLQAIYEIQLGEHSFIAVIQGGSTSVGGRLDGVIVSGWRIGAHVRVAFATLSSCVDRDGIAHGPCFAGTIQVGRAPGDGLRGSIEIVDDPDIRP